MFQMIIGCAVTATAEVWDLRFQLLVAKVTILNNVLLQMDVYVFCSSFLYWNNHCRILNTSSIFVKHKSSKHLQCYADSQQVITASTGHEFFQYSCLFQIQQEQLLCLFFLFISILFTFLLPYLSGETYFLQW